MNLTRYMTQHRPEVLLGVLSFLSLASLVSGTSSTIIHRAVTRLVSISAYPVLAARTSIEEAADYAFDFVWNYNALRRDNERNQEVQARLQLTLAQVEELAAENRRLRSMLDFARSEPRLTLVPVRVIENLRGMLTIDQGRVQGMEPRMAVITKDGVVGMVTEVHDFTASVATLHHRDCKIGAMVYRNRLRAYDGVVKANSINYNYNYICTMDVIDMKNEVRKGDILVTNPESFFPAGIPVGTVSVVHDGGTLWRSAEVEPAVDPYVLDEVFVVRRYVPPEEYFTGSRQPDAYRPVTSVAPELPDDRTFQERFAP